MTPQEKKASKKETLESQLTRLTLKTCIVDWSNGDQTESTLAAVFPDESAWEKYAALAKAGKPYPVRVTFTDKPGQGVFTGQDETELNESLGQHFTQALEQFVKGAIE